MKIDINDLRLLNSVFNSVTLLYAIFIFVVNCILVYILFKKCDIKSIEIGLTLFLCFTELLSGACLFSISIAKLKVGYHYFDLGTIQCRVYSFLIQYISRVEIYTVMILSIMRYNIVCYKNEKSAKFWLVSLALSLAPATAIYVYSIFRHDESPNISYLTCQPFSVPGKVTAVISILIPFLFIVPCWTVTFCYFSIAWTVNRQLNNMRSEAITNEYAVLLKVIRKQKFKLFFQLFLVFWAYNINFFPSYITFVLKFAIGYKRTPFVDALVYVMVYSAVAINPIITIIFQPEVNTEFILILVKFQAKFKKVLHNITHRN
jgi:hypothetical protein